MGSKLHSKMFKVARAVSELSEFPRIQIGAVVARKHTILAVGVNQTKSHPLQKRYNKERFEKEQDTCQHHLHAEMDAILKVKNVNDLSKASIFVFRRNGDGVLAMSRPCPACMAKIVESGIRKIHYTTDAGYAFEQLV